VINPWFSVSIPSRSHNRSLLGGSSAGNCGNSGCGGNSPHLSPSRPFHILNNPSPGSSPLIPSGPNLLDPSVAALRLGEHHPQVTQRLHLRSGGPSIATTLGLTPLFPSTSLPYYSRSGNKFLRTRGRHRGMNMGQKVSGKNWHELN